MTSEPTPRAARLARALRLEYLTIAWNLVEGTIAVAAARAAGSIALLGFGLDSFVECASALVLVWRLRAEAAARDPVAVARLDRRARRLVALSLALLATYVAIDAVLTLVRGDRPSPSLVGMILLVASIGVMVWLARAKRRAAAELGSRALEADAFQTTACWWLSLTALSGVALNSFVGWWWADPAAALALAALIAREARASWHGDPC